MQSQNPRHLRPSLISIDDVLNHFSANYSQIKCFQVGANDGVYDDPIHQYIVRDKWHSILVEPLKDVFQKGLQPTYAKCDHVILENVAIGTNGGQQSLYKIGFTDQKWAMGLTSFNKANLEKHIEAGYVDRMAAKNGVTPPSDKSSYIVEEVVEIKSPTELLAKHGFTKLDVLAIDTEGYDFEVLKTFDFNKFNPHVILFESKHLSDSDFMAAQKMLKDNEYSLYWQKGNTLALSKKALEVIPSWKRALFQLRAFLNKV